ncbi:unnamed protein product [Cylicocyclus nassatus]|uniref:Ionotropic glutamate receptor C-terminal domain-containing protein n=1 Tax=Cylicocyclus nassatus TaxID=53992 RepID=A0AA36GN63_CYLNA|nr:unnamed protein product [Cylicocyclus nassatus]
MAEIEGRFHNIWKKMSMNKSLSRMDRARMAVWDYPIANKFTNIWRHMQRSKLPSNIDDAVRRVLDPEEQFAFIGDASHIKYMAYTNCQLQQVGTELARKPYAIAVQSGSYLRDQISSAILVLLNQKHLETLKEKWWEDNPKRAICADTSDESDGISVQNIGGVFIFISAGLLLSVVTLTIECFYHRRQNLHTVENHRDDKENKETNGTTSIASPHHHDNCGNSSNRNNHITSCGTDNAGFEY